MEEEAHRVFQRADIEGKGFLVKKDMQRFQQEVSLSADQLDAVFESLDACATGYLTLDQFLAGFSNLANGTILGKGDTHEDYSEDCHNNNTINNSQQVVRNIMNMDMLHKSANTLKRINKLIVQEPSRIELEEGWLQFVQNLGIDMLRLKEQVEELERVLAARDKRHEVEVQKLFDEFETQLCEEKDKMSDLMVLKEKSLRQEFKEKVEANDQQISEAIAQRDEVMERLYLLEVEENNTKIENANLRKLKEEQEAELDRHINLMQELQNQLDAERKRSEVEAKRQFEQGFMLAQKISTLETEGLLHQLKIIKNMQAVLKDESVRRSSVSSNEKLSVNHF